MSFTQCSNMDANMPVCPKLEEPGQLKMTVKITIRGYTYINIIDITTISKTS